MNWRRILTTALALTAFACVVYMQGCTNLKTTLPNGTVILYQNMLKRTTAKGAELYYEDPNCVFWVNLEDPNGIPNEIKAITPYGVYETK